MVTMGSAVPTQGAAGTSVVSNGQVVAQAPQQPILLPMITLTTGRDNVAPMLTVVAREKEGKSSLAVSLFGYPEPHMQPLIHAWDESGPDACLRLGFQPHSIRMRQMPGNTAIEKARYVCQTIERRKGEYLAQYGAIVVDCMSTAVTAFKEDAKQTPKNRNNPDGRAHFYELKEYVKEYVNRVIDLGLPSIWLGWRMDGHPAEKEKPQELGGMDLDGAKVRNYVQGRANHNFILEKKKIGVGGMDPTFGAADDEGCVRVFHTRPWDMVNAGGRYSHVLPEPCYANFSWVLGQITGRGQYARRS